MKKFDLMIEALRLRTRGDSLSNISVRLGVSKSTLQGWFNRLDQADLNYEKAKSMTPSQLEDALALIRRPTSKDFPPDWHRFIDLVARKARTVQECYDFYCSEACKHGVSAMGRSSFYEQFNRAQKELRGEERRLYLHNNFLPASVAMIDYSGDGVRYKKDGKVHTAQIFVGVLGHSGLIYCLATPTQKRSDWFSGIIGMFAMFGGITEELWLDNSTPLVRKASRYDPILAPEFEELCRYYGTTPHAVAPGEPTYKGLCENAVKQCQAFILRELNERDFFEVEDINRAIQPLLDKLNAKPLTNRSDDVSRWKRFNDEERCVLKPLPFPPYSPELELVKRKVLKGDIIRLHDIRYAVPWGHQGETLLLAIDRHKNTLTGYRLGMKTELFSTRLRRPNQGDEPTRPDYLPEELRLVAMNREEIKQLICSEAGTGEQTRAFAEHLARLSNSRARSHLIRLHRRLSRSGLEMIEAVCAQVMKLAKPTIREFDRIYDNFVSRKETERPQVIPTDISGDEDQSEVRGPRYFTCPSNESQGASNEEN